MIIYFIDLNQNRYLLKSGSKKNVFKKKKIFIEEIL